MKREYWNAGILNRDGMRIWFGQAPTETEARAMLEKVGRENFSNQKIVTWVEKQTMDLTRQQFLDLVKSKGFYIAMKNFERLDPKVALEIANKFCKAVSHISWQPGCGVPGIKIRENVYNPIGPCTNRDLSEWISLAFTGSSDSAAGKTKLSWANVSNYRKFAENVLTKELEIAAS